MKKIYLFLAAMFALLSTNLYAQYAPGDIEDVSNGAYTVDAENPLITDASQMSSPYSHNDHGGTDGGNLADGVLIDGDLGNFWHSYWGGDAVTPGTHYFQVEMTDDLGEDELIAFVFTRRNVANDQTVEWSVMGTNDPDAEKSDCEELAYVKTPLGATNETLMSDPFKRSEYKYLRFYSESQTSSTGSYGARGYFHLAEFNIYPVNKMDDVEAALLELDKIYEQYSAYQDDFEDRTGSLPGDYSEEAVNAFLEALLAYIDYTFEETVEGITACGERIKETYEAIEPTKVPFTPKDLANGYYRIHAGMDYSTGDKYMCVVRDLDTGNYLGYWATPDLADPVDAIQTLWKIEAKTDTTYDIVNLYSNARFTKVTRSDKVIMSSESDSLMAIDVVATDHYSNITYVNIRLNAQPGSDGTYLHQNGHSSGAGEANTLVGWYNTWSTTNGCGASEWYFEEVDEAEAQDIINNYDRSADQWKSEFKQMMQQAPNMLTIAIDIAKIPVVTDVAQFSSPFTEPTEGALANLIDGNTGTFWHSIWKDTAPYEGNHYLQIELTEPLTHEVYLQFTRRSVSNDHTTKWSIRGTNEAEFTPEDECEELLEAETPYGSNTETLKTEPFSTKDYKYIRLYSEEQAPSTRTYWHASELNLYYELDNPTSQYVALGDIAKNLEALVNEFADLEDEDLDEDLHYKPLKAAFDAFVAKYVDPTALRDTIALAETVVDKVVVGTNPGFYPAGTADAISKNITDAKAYDKAGAYTPEKSAEFLANFKAQMAAIDEAPIKVQEGKWYRFRFGTEEEFDAYNWSKSGNLANYFILDADTEEPDTVDYYNQALFGKYLTVANRVVKEIGENADGDVVTAYRIEPITKDEVAIGNYIFCDDLADIKDADMALFRFVNVGDSAYAIQNKATGLFLQRPSEGGDVRLGIYPALYTQKVIGWGQNSFFSTTIAGTSLPPMHLAQSGNILTQWGSNTAGWGEYDSHRGSFYVEEVEDVAANYSFGDYKMKAWPGAWSAHCYAVPVTAKNADEGQMWTVGELVRTPGEDEANETVSLTLVPIKENSVVAGRPFIYIKSGEYTIADDRDEDDEPAVSNFSFKFEIKNRPSTSGALKGVFDQVSVGQGALAIGNIDQTDGSVEHLSVTASGANVASGAAYIAETDAPFGRKAVIELELDAQGDGIATALQNVSRIGGIYTIDGRLVNARGNINDLQNMPKGAYIINGTKVLVK